MDNMSWAPRSQTPWPSCRPYRFAKFQGWSASLDLRGVQSTYTERFDRIGRVGERWLQAMGVETVGDIYHLRGKLYLVVRSLSTGIYLMSRLMNLCHITEGADWADLSPASVPWTW